VDAKFEGLSGGLAMTRLDGPRKTLAFFVLLSALCVGTAHPAQAADPMDMVPDNALFCVRINNPDTALGQVDLFLTGLSPMPISVSMLAKGQLAQMLGNPQSPQPAGLNMSGAFVVFGPLPGVPDPSRVGILIPVTNYDQFVAGNANVSEPNAAGISKIGPQGGEMLIATQVGDYVLASMPGSEGALANMKKATSSTTSGLTASLDSTERKRAQTAPVWAYANVQLAGQMFGPMVQAQIQQAKQTMQAMQGQEQDAPGMAQAVGAMDMYASVLDTLTKETRFISLSLEPSANKIGLAFTLASMPNTPMAQMLQGSATKQSNKLAGYMSDGAAMNFLGSMDNPFWKKLNAALMDMLPKFMGAASADDAAISQIKKMVTDITDGYAGPVAGSIKAGAQSNAPLEVSFVATLKDAQKFQQVFDQVEAMFKEGPLADLHKDMGVKTSFDLKRKAETYKGVAIDSATFKMEVTDPNSQEAQVLGAMYGGGLNINFAVVDNHLAYAAAAEPGALIHKLIDQVKAGGPTQNASEVQTAMGLIPGADKADLFVSFNVLRFMQIVAGMAPQQIPQMNMPTQSSVAMTGNVGEGKATVELAVPKEHAREIMMAFMMMQQQKMMQQQQMQQGQGQP
jgi:hypothetical protein